MYFIYDPVTCALEGYRFSATAQGYEPIEATSLGRVPSEALKLHLGAWPGRYHGFDGTWLRWFRPDGSLLPSAEEAKEQAEEARRQAEDTARDLTRRLSEYERKFGPLT